MLRCVWLHYQIDFFVFIGPVNLNVQPDATDVVVHCDEHIPFSTKNQCFCERSWVNMYQLANLIRIVNHGSSQTSKLGPGRTATPGIGQSFCVFDLRTRVFQTNKRTHCHRVHKHENFSNLARLRNCSTTRRQREKTARQVRRVPKQTQKTTSAAERHRSITGCSGRTLNAPHFGNPMIA